MEIITDAQLLERIEAFLVKHAMSPSKFGREAMGDPALVFQLRDAKRSLSLKSAARVGDFMDEYGIQSPFPSPSGGTTEAAAA